MTSEFGLKVQGDLIGSKVQDSGGVDYLNCVFFLPIKRQKEINNSIQYIHHYPSCIVR